MHTRPDEQQIIDFLQNTAGLEAGKTVLKWLSTPEGQEYISSHFDHDLSVPDIEGEFLIDHLVPSQQMFQNIQSKIQKQEQHSLRMREFRRIGLKIAAFIAIPLLIASGILLWKNHSQAPKTIAWQEIYVPLGEKYQAVFSDGTRVLLNSGTHLKYPLKFDRKYRQVVLSGEAYFYVHKNACQPFFVHTGDLTVKVTGTSFNVKAYADESKIVATLDEGRISLWFTDSHRPEYVMKPGQRAVFSRANRKLSIDSVKTHEDALWWNNVLIFNDTPLSQVLQTLERHYSVKFKIIDPEIAAYTYTIRFDNETIDNVLTQLKEITPIQYVMKNGVIEVRKGKIR